VETANSVEVRNCIDSAGKSDRKRVLEISGMADTACSCDPSSKEDTERFFD
jgi:hypothetical protein